MSLIVLTKIYLHVFCGSVIGERAKRARHSQVSSTKIRDIRECDSTLYLGLTGIVQKLIQKSMGMVHRILSIYSPYG